MAVHTCYSSSARGSDEKRVPSRSTLALVCDRLVHSASQRIQPAHTQQDCTHAFIDHTRTTRHGSACLAWSCVEHGPRARNSGGYSQIAGGSIPISAHSSRAGPKIPVTGSPA